MARRKMKLSTWVTTMATMRELGEIEGRTIAGAAKYLDITQQGIYGALSRDRLDLLTVVDRHGDEVFAIITSASLERYKRTYRLPKQRDLDLTRRSGTV